MNIRTWTWAQNANEKIEITIEWVSEQATERMFDWKQCTISFSVWQEWFFFSNFLFRRKSIFCNTCHSFSFFLSLNHIWEGKKKSQNINIDWMLWIFFSTSLRCSVLLFIYVFFCCWKFFDTKEYLVLFSVFTKRKIDDWKITKIKHTTSFSASIRLFE